MGPGETSLWTNGRSAAPHTVLRRDFGRLLDRNFLQIGYVLWR